jgi:hypothetical protein
VHGPVVAPELGEFPRAVQRIDDPDAVRAQSHRVIGALFRQDRIIGTLGGERLHQKVVGSLVPRSLPFRGVRIRELRPNAEQQPTGLGGQPGGQIMVIHRQLRAILNILVSMANFTRSCPEMGTTPVERSSP